MRLTVPALWAFFWIIFVKSIAYVIVGAQARILMSVVFG